MLIRRIIAVIVGLVFIFSVWISLFSLRITGTALDEDFYIKHLREADIFNFFYDDLLPKLIDETDEEDLGRDVDLSRVNAHIVMALREILPPEFLQEEAEEAIKVFVPYLKGATDEFAIEIPLAERIRAAGPALKNALRDGEIVDLVYDDLLNPSIEDALVEADGIPFGIQVSSQEMVEIFRRIAPDEWLQEQLVNAVDEMLPYLAGDSEDFRVVIGVSEQVAAARVEIKALLTRWDGSTFLFEEIVDPAVESALGDSFTVPFNLTVTPEDVQTVLRETLTEEWLRIQVEGLVDVTADYLTGARQEFTYTVPLDELNEPAVASVGRLMDAKLDTFYASLRQCTAQELQGLDLDTFVRDGIPCRPPGVSAEQLKTAVQLTNYDAEVARLVDGVLPNAFTFTESQIRTAIGEDQWSTLQDVRGWIQDGLIFTRGDLEDEVAKAGYEGPIPYEDLDDAARLRVREMSEDVDNLRDAREEIQKITFTQDDLRERLDEEDSDAWENLQDLRNDLKDIRGQLSYFRILAWLIPALLFASIGMLGARSWPNKMIWSASFLAVPSILIFVFAGPAYTSGFRGDLEREITEEIEERRDVDAPSETDILEKGRDIALNAVDDFSSGLSRRAMILMIVSLVAIAGGIVWRYWDKIRPPPESPAPPGSTL